jgi:hypothetical protein
MYLTIGEDEYYTECTYEYIRGSRGAWDDGVQIEPDISSTVEISKVLVDFSEDKEATRLVEIDLPPQVIRDLEQELLEEIES